MAGVEAWTKRSTPARAEASTSLPVATTLSLWKLAAGPQGDERAAR